MRAPWAVVLVLVMVGCNKPAEHTAVEPEAADTEGVAEDEDLSFDEQPVDEGEHVPEEVQRAQQTVTASVAAARANMDAQRLAIETSKAEVDAARAELDRELAKIDALERRLDERLGIGEVAEKRRNQRISGLAKIVIAMSPQAAADMLARMPVEDAQDIILAMAQENQRKASKLLSAMPGDRAAALGQRYLDHDPKTLVDGANPPPTRPRSDDDDDDDDREDES